MRLQLIVLATMLVSAPTAIAAPITFEFTSSVVSVESGFLGVEPGDQVIGRYLFESTTPSTSADPTVGRYEPITGTFEVQFGLLSLSIPLTYIEVLSRPELDRYTVAALSGTDDGDIQLQLVLATNQNLDAFTTIDLPLSSPQLNLFENNQFILYVSEGPSNFIQQITASPITTLETVPEPATLAVLGAGMAMLSITGIRRRTSR